MQITLLLGSTGVDKREVVVRLSAHRKQLGIEPHEIPFFDLERDFVVRHYQGEMFPFLDEPEKAQRSTWRSAWAELVAKLNELDADHVLVGMHGALVRDLYGVRSPIDLPAIAAVQPDRIITLIDDVYSGWARTERRAQAAEYRGRPTLGQLLDARRAELLIGDLIAAHVAAVGPPPHWVLAVKHPARVLHRLLTLDAAGMAPIYVSFPISGPRRAARERNPQRTEEVNAFLTSIADLERESEHAVVFNPLTVDELPLLEARPEADSGSGKFPFSFRDRWDLRAFWPDDILLTEEQEDSVDIVTQQLDEAAGAIRSDIGVRDYRLVRQCRRLLALNPYYEGHPASGIRNEITLAVYERRPVHVYQDHVHDPQHQARATFHGDTGALGRLPTASYVTFHDDQAEALRAAFAIN